MHVDHNQCTHQCPLESVEVFSHNSHHLCDHFFHETLKSPHSLFGIALLIEHCLSDSLAPLDLIHQQNVLRVIGKQPFLAIQRVFVGVLLECLFGDVVERFYHHFLDLHEPVLHGSFGKDAG